MRNYEKLKKEIHHTLGIDLTAYKEQQMRRRINQWLDRHTLASYNELVATITSDVEHRRKFTEYLTINTSNFFRDTRVFDEIENHVLPAISQNNRPRIWSAGASIGAEIYSISILLKETKVTPALLLATDLDESVLKKARAGIYLVNQVSGISAHYLKKYFTEREDGQWVLHDSIKSPVVFKRHDLLKDRYERNFDLILCRNVFIYFTSDTQSRLITNFMDSLNHGGYFIVGSAEQIMDPARYGLERVSYCIYQKS